MSTSKKPGIRAFSIFVKAYKVTLIAIRFTRSKTLLQDVAAAG